MYIKEYLNDVKCFLTILTSIFHARDDHPRNTKVFPQGFCYTQLYDACTAYIQVVSDQYLGKWMYHNYMFTNIFCLVNHRLLFIEMFVWWLIFCSLFSALTEACTMPWAIAPFCTYKLSWLLTWWVCLYWYSPAVYYYI